MWKKQSQFAEKEKGDKKKEKEEKKKETKILIISKSYISKIPKTSFTSIHLEVWSHEPTNLARV